MTKILTYNIMPDEKYDFVIESCPYRQGGNEGVYGLGSLKCEKKCKHCIKRDINKHTVECDFRVLDLSLKYHWYDEIESGRKTVEYRELSEWWTKRLVACKKTCPHGDGINNIYGFHKCIHCSRFEAQKYDAVRFHRGQGSKQTMMFECARIIIAKGHVYFGALKDIYMFNIYLGKRLQ